MMTNPYQAYQDNAVNTASGGELTLMLYNGCLKFLRASKQNIEENNYEKKNTYIQKSQDIIRELMVTLDPEIEISKQLMSLYDYMLRQMQQANIKNETELIDEVIDLVTELRDTWKEALLQTRRNNSTKGVEI